LLEAVVEHRGRGFGEGGPGEGDVGGIADEQLVEEDAVAQAPDLGAAFAVDDLDPSDQLQTALELVLDVLIGRGGGDQEAAGVDELGLDAVGWSSAI
jgi:hypothetical protein